MPSTTPPVLPHYTTTTDSSQYAPATVQVGANPAHSWGLYRFHQHQHQPAAIYDTTSGLYSHASFSQDYTPTDHIVLPSSSTFSSPAQQAIPRYSSSMSRHPAWAYPGYTPWQSLGQSADSSVDAPTSFFAPPIVQNVWLIECKHCRTFLTNRGMKAVLLLRPQVALYSTDALPVNCSAYSAMPPSTESPLQQPNQQHRTCECLTQTLCCHGCGTSVGYTVVVPCTLCISSGASRGTNGHRFVFHSSEIIVSERHYAPGEPGILPAYTGQSSSSPSFPNPAWSPPSFLPSTPDPAEVHPSLTASPALTSSHYVIPPPAPESPCPASLSVFPDPQKPSPQPLRAGDLLYWHHLKQGGEIPGATYDPRARGITPIVFDR